MKTKFKVGDLIQVDTNAPIIYKEHYGIITTCKKRGYSVYFPSFNKTYYILEGEAHKVPGIDYD